MRGIRKLQGDLISLVNVEALIAPNHPIRVIKRLCDQVLQGMSGHFDEIYSQNGCPSVPPEMLLKGKVLQALYSVRSDRQLCVRLQTDLLFRWFVDLPLDEKPFDASTYSKNQDRLLKHAVADLFFSEVVEMAKRQGWVSNDHFSVDGTLIDAWASAKSFRPKGKDDGDGNGWSDFKGKGRSNQTHESKTDPEAMLMRKSVGKEAKLCFAGHASMENRNGLCVLFEVKRSVGESEPKVAVNQMRELQDRGFRPKTVGADKGYHCEAFVTGMRDQGVIPRPALNERRRRLRVQVSKVYELSQRTRRRIEMIFGWTKSIGQLRRTRYRGVERTNAFAQIVVASYNLLRMAGLSMQAPPETAGA